MLERAWCIKGPKKKPENIGTCRLHSELWPLSKVQWKIFEEILNVGVVTPKILS